MKRFLSFLSVIFICVFLCVPAFASAAEQGTDTGTDSGSDTTVLVPDVNVYNEVVVEDTEDLGTYVGTTVYALNPVSPSDTSGLKSIMLSLIGDWDSIIVEHRYESSNGYTNYLREIQLDYPWLCSCAIFLVVLFCVLRGGFACLCRK